MLCKSSAKKCRQIMTLQILNIGKQYNTSYQTCPKQAYSNLSSTNINSNLRPLSKDTVCFTGGAKVLTEGMNGGMIVPKEAVNQLIKEAKEVALDFENDLKHYLVPFIADEEHPNRPIKDIVCRVKSDFSMREKAKTRKLRKNTEIKAGIDDLIGLRIITNSGKKEDIEPVLKRLTKGVSEGKFKIFEIENYCPDSSLSFATDGTLKKLQAAGNRILSNGTTRRGESLPSGYTALHFSAYLPKGYKAEIQLMNAEVEKVKEIEDFLYKIKTNKTLPKKYKPIEKALSELRINEALQRSVNSYTRSLYKLAKEVKLKTGKFAFPPAPDYVPPEFDFNNIVKMKKRCDAAAKNGK